MYLLLTFLIGAFFGAAIQMFVSRKVYRTSFNWLYDMLVDTEEYKAAKHWREYHAARQ